MMNSEKKITINDFKELGENLDSVIGTDALAKSLYNELKTLGSKKGSRGIYLGKKLLVQIYFPDKSDIFLGTLKVRENINERTERFDANIIIQNYIHKRDTRTPPVFFSTEEYDAAERTGKLEYRTEMFRVLSRKSMLMYFVHRTEKVEE